MSKDKPNSGPCDTWLAEQKAMREKEQKAEQKAKQPERGPRIADIFADIAAKIAGGEVIDVCVLVRTRGGVQRNDITGSWTKNRPGSLSMFSVFLAAIAKSVMFGEMHQAQAQAPVEPLPDSRKDLQ